MKLHRDGIWLVIAGSAFAFGALLGDASGRNACTDIIKQSNDALEQSNAALDQAIVALRGSADSLRIATDALSGAHVEPAADEVRSWRIDDLSPAEVDALGTMDSNVITSVDAVTDAIGARGNM